MIHQRHLATLRLPGGKKKTHQKYYFWCVLTVGQLLFVLCRSGLKHAIHGKTGDSIRTESK
jgi:hypothetical protein